MINEINSQKPLLKPEKPVPVSKSNSSQPTKSSAPIQSAVTRSAASLVAGTGLPADKLSASIVSFARFFSLALKPDMLAAIRRQAFSHVLPQNAANAASSGQKAAPDLKGLSEILKTREALSLAAAAAESKSVELSPKGLETYAEAVDPDWKKRQDDEQQRDRRNKNQNDKDEKDSFKIESITADRLKKMSLEYMEQNPLLEILNKLPGKNGQRWIVLPFDFSDGEKHFRVSIRILLDEKNLSGVLMAIQISVNKEELTDNKDQLTENKVQIKDDGSFEKKWLFVLNSTEGKTVKVVIYPQNDMTEKEQSKFKKDLAAALEIPVKSISVKYSGASDGYEESFPCEAGRDTQIPLIDKAV